MSRTAPGMAAVLAVLLTGCWWAGEESSSPVPEPEEETPGSEIAPLPPDEDVDDWADPGGWGVTPDASAPQPAAAPVSVHAAGAPPRKKIAPRQTAALRRSEPRRAERRRERTQPAPEPVEESPTDTAPPGTSPPEEAYQPPEEPLVTGFSAGLESQAQADPDPTYKGPRTGTDWLQIGYDRKAEGDPQGAREAFETAEEWGADPQIVHLELGYLAMEEGREKEAGEHFKEAHRIAMERARAARQQLQGFSRVVWGEFYGEAFGWHRFAPQDSTNLVPVARLRGYVHPFVNVDLDPYVFVQVSRDTASTGRSPEGYPLIYADNTLMFGGGVLFRFWKRQVGLFAQIGPAVNLLDDGRERVWLDLRAGAFITLESPECRPQLVDGGRGSAFVIEPCAELYGEAVYVSRFDHNLMAQARGRLGMAWLLTGPVAWQPAAEARVLKDIDNDFWNNLADFGIGHRWRLLHPFSLDLMLGVHFGTYFGLENANPAPDPHYYSELRLQAATGFVF